MPTAENEYKEFAWGKQNYGKKFEPMWVNRGKVEGDYDVKLDLWFCGVCHSDLHLTENHLHETMYPIVPGHELAGYVAEVGPKVTRIKVGDRAAIGVSVDSCLECEMCKAGMEQYCVNGKSVHTYNDKKRYGHIPGNPEERTFGGYSGTYTLHEHFVFKLPDAMELEKVGPVLCAGITLYDPLIHWGAVEAAAQGKKMTIGVAGIGGLGTMGIKLAAAMGHRVVAISTSNGKEKMAREKGATDFVVSKDPEQMKAWAGKIDLLLNCVSAVHELNFYLPLVATNGTMVMLGIMSGDHSINQMDLMAERKTVASSHIGGNRAIEGLLELCAKHGIAPDIQMITADQLDWAYEQLAANKDGLRYVIDIKKSMQNEAFMPK